MHLGKNESANFETLRSRARSPQKQLASKQTNKKTSQGFRPMSNHQKTNKQKKQNQQTNKQAGNRTSQTNKQTNKQKKQTNKQKKQVKQTKLSSNQLPTHWQPEPGPASDL